MSRSSDMASEFVENFDLETDFSEVELATAGDREHIPATARMQGSKSTKQSGTITSDSAEEAQYEVDRLIEEEIARGLKFNDFFKKYFGHDYNDRSYDPETQSQVDTLFASLHEQIDQEGTITDTTALDQLIQIETEHKANMRVANVFNLFETLEQRPLTTEEFNKLMTLASEMNRDVLIENTINMGREIHRSNIIKLEKMKEGKVFAIFKPVVTKLTKVFGLKKDNVGDNLDEVIETIDGQAETKTGQGLSKLTDAKMMLLDSIADSNFDAIAETIDNESFAERANIMVADFEKWQEAEATNFANIHLYGCYNIEDLQECENAWSQFFSSFVERVVLQQTMHLKNASLQAKEYLKEVREDGAMVCEINGQTIVITKDNFVDDMAVFYQAANGFEVDLSQLSPAVESESTIEMPEVEETPEVGVAETTDVVDDPKEETTEEAEESKEDVTEEVVETKIEEEQARKNLKNLPEIDINEYVDNTEEEIKPEVVYEESADMGYDPIKSDRDAYLAVISLFMPREEAEEYANIQENIDAFNNSDLGYTKFLEAKEKGEISEDTLYYDFGISQLEKRNAMEESSTSLEDELDAVDMTLDEPETSKTK